MRRPRGGGYACWTLGVTCFQNLRPALGGLPRLLRQAGALPPGADTEAAGPHQGRAPLRRGAAQDAQKGVCGGHCAARWRGRQGLERSQNLRGLGTSDSWCVPLRILSIPQHQTQTPTDLGTVKLQTQKSGPGLCKLWATDQIQPGFVEPES